MSLYSIGDSHCDYCFNGIPSLKVIWLGPRTMYRVGRDGLSLVDLRSMGVNDSDIVIWSFGEIDVRTHIGRICDKLQKDEVEVIEELVSKYMAVAILNRYLIKDVTIVISSIIPPSNKEDREDETLPFYGSLSDRIRITNLLNYKLRKACRHLNFPFLDIYTPFADDDGALPLSSRADLLHLDRKFVPMVQSIFEKELHDHQNRGRATLDENTKNNTYEAIQSKYFWSKDSYGRIFNKATVDSRSWFVHKERKCYIPRIAYQTDVLWDAPNVNIHRIPSGKDVNIKDFSSLPVRKYSQAFVVGGNNNYYHTLIDHFANIYFYDQWGLKDKRVPILIGGKELFHKRLAELFGFSGNMLIESNDAERIELETVYMPNKCFDEWGRLLKGDFFNWLKDKVVNKYMTGERGKRIYLSRQGASQRVISNEDEITELLREFNFIKVQPDKMTLQEQVSCFADSEVILGPHGAGLANTIFAPPEATIIELMPNGSWTPKFFEYICQSHGQSFSRILVESDFNQREFYLSPSILKKHLENIP